MAIENNEEGKVVRIVPPPPAVIAVSILAVSGALLLLALFVNALKESQYIGRDINSQTTITVSGDGDAYAMPDIATVSFSITQESKDSIAARKVVDEKMKKIQDYLLGAGIAEKDIKTTGYNLYPKYDYVRQPCILEKVGATGISYPCYNDGKQVLIGYEVTQSITLKIRKLDDAGKILGGLTDNGATNVSGLAFMVENEDGVQSTAREAAIAKAKTKANQLAKELGVTLVRIVSFNEGGNYPIYYQSEYMKTMSADSGVASGAPTIPAGENKYTSNVTIVYEIR